MRRPDVDEPELRPVTPRTEALVGAVLLARLAARDAASFGLLIGSRAGRMFGQSLRLLGDAGAAESAIEAASLALWRRAPNLIRYGSMSVPGYWRGWTEGAARSRPLIPPSCTQDSDSARPRPG